MVNYLPFYVKQRKNICQSKRKEVKPIAGKVSGL